MIKRSCVRFTIHGTTLNYRKKSLFLSKPEYLPDLYPVIDLSRGGARFLSHSRLEPGKSIFVKLNIPNTQCPCEIKATIRWISKNPEPSYRYQTGISFHPYGTKKNENPVKALYFLEKLEAAQTKPNPNNT